MSYDEAMQHVAALYRSGEMSADEYELERVAIEYAHGEIQTAQENAA